MWSIERYLIARSCEVRLALTGTVSSISPVLRALRQGVVTGVLPEHNESKCGCNHQALTRAWQRILNTRRKADSVIPVATRVYCNSEGITEKDDCDCIKICLDFVTVHGDTAKLFWITNKKFQGTPEIKVAYIGIATALTQLLGVRKVKITELILIPMPGNHTGYDLLQAPEFIVPADVTVFSKLLKLPHGGKSDRRKCLLATDPCPARLHCPVVNPKK